MTVAELIEQLKKMPQDSLAVVPGYEGGYDNIQVTTDSIILDENWDGVKDKFYWYYGRHARYYEEMGDQDKVNCVVIGRTL